MAGRPKKFNSETERIAARKKSLKKAFLKWKSKNNEKRKKYMQDYFKTAKYKIWLEKNKDKIKESQRKSAKKWRKKKGKIFFRDKSKKYYAQNEKRKDYLRHYFKSEKYKKYVNKHNKIKRVISPQFRLSQLLRGRVRGILRKKKAKKTNSTLILLGCTIKELISHFDKKFKKGMNWSNMNKWHIDHIKPISSFDLSNPEEQKKCFHFSNLQPLWAKENLKKGSKY